MANQYTGLLATAGIAPDAHGMQLILDLPNKSVFMGMGTGVELITLYPIAPGDSLSAPVIGARTVTSRARGATTETAAVSYSALSDSEVSFTKSAGYDAWEIGYQTLNDLSPERAAMLANGTIAQSTMAMANDFDSSILGLYSSAANSVGSSGVDFTIGNLAEAKKLLKVANAPEPYFAVLPSTQEDHLAQTDELTRYDVRGEGNTMVNGGSFYRWQGINIFTTGNVPTATSTAHGLVFSQSGILAALRDFPLVREWDEPANTAVRGLVFIDYAYAASPNSSSSDWIVDFQTTDG